MNNFEVKGKIEMSKDSQVNNTLFIDRNDIIKLDVQYEDSLTNF